MTTPQPTIPFLKAADLDSITTLVDIELKRLEESKREQGWTPWILSATLAALCWQLADYVAAKPNWLIVILFWALFIILSVTIGGIIDGLNAGHGSKRVGIRYFRSSFFSAGRSARLFEGIKLTSAAVLLCWLTPLTGAVKWSWILLFSIYAYYSFAHVVGSWTDIPHPIGSTGEKDKNGWVISGLFWILHLTLVTFAVVELWQRLANSYTVSDARLSLLGFAVTYLLSLLLAYRINEPLRRELIHLRRSIGFGEVDANAARQMLFELLHGSELSVLARPRFEEVTKKLDDLFIAIDEASHTSSQIVEGGLPVRMQESRIAKISKHIDDAESAWLDLSVWLIVARISGGLPDDVAIRGKELKARLKTGKKQLKDLKLSLKRGSQDKTNLNEFSEE